MPILNPNPNCSLISRTPLVGSTKTRKPNITPGEPTAAPLMAVTCPAAPLPLPNASHLQPAAPCTCTRRHLGFARLQNGEGERSSTTKSPTSNSSNTSKDPPPPHQAELCCWSKGGARGEHIGVQILGAVVSNPRLANARGSKCSDLLLLHAAGSCRAGGAPAMPKECNYCKGICKV